MHTRLLLLLLWLVATAAQTSDGGGAAQTSDDSTVGPPPSGSSSDASSRQYSAPPGGWAAGPGGWAPKADFVTSLTGLGSTPIGLTPLTWPGTSILTLEYLNLTDPDAVCNDGTSAGMYFAAATTSPDLWLVYLEGSMFCWDGPSCHERYTSSDYWMSSAPWAPQLAQYGIFSTAPNSSSWSGANRAYLKYCSSDLWSGDVGASDATLGWAFRGQRIVRTAITQLVKSHGMGATAGQRLLFGGCSAGAIGAMNSLDAVAGLTLACEGAGAGLPACTASGLTVQGFLDGAALVDIRPAGWSWSNDLIPLQTLVANMVTLVGPTLDPRCVEAFPGPAVWKCLWGQYRLPIVSTPFFANVPQFDDFEMQYDMDNLGPSTPAQLAWVDQFQQAVLLLIRSLPPGTGVFSSTCLVHCLSGEASFQNMRVPAEPLPGVLAQSLAQTLSNWYFPEEADGSASAVSACTGWDCIDSCGVTNNCVPCIMGQDPGGQAALTCYPIQLPTRNSPPLAPSAAPDGVFIPGELSDSSAAHAAASYPPAAAAPPAAFVAPEQYVSNQVLTPAQRRAAQQKSGHGRGWLAAAALAAAALGALAVAGRTAASRAVDASGEREPLVKRKKKKATASPTAREEPQPAFAAASRGAAEPRDAYLEKLFGTSAVGKGTGPSAV